MRLAMRVLHVAAFLGAVAVGVTLWVWGQPLISTSGQVRLWVNSVWSNENSQQIADWYTLSHVIHGLLLAVAGHLSGRWLPFAVAYAVAIATGVAWEIVEHTDWVLDRFRGQTIYQGYIGDSVLNGVSDYLFMLAGFAAGAWLGAGRGVILALCLEALSAAVARDSLVLTTIRVVHPIPAVTAWQDATNPRNTLGADPPLR